MIWKLLDLLLVIFEVVPKIMGAVSDIKDKKARRAKLKELSKAVSDAKTKGDTSGLDKFFGTERKDARPLPSGPSQGTPYAHAVSVDAVHDELWSGRERQVSSTNSESEE